MLCPDTGSGYVSVVTLKIHPSAYFIGFCPLYVQYDSIGVVHIKQLVNLLSRDHLAAATLLQLSPFTHFKPHSAQEVEVGGGVLGNFPNRQ